MDILSKPNVWFTSDYHIGHARILQLGKGRPFASLDEMHAAIADRHNAVVKPGDWVFNLGDFAFKGDVELAWRFRQRLLGRQHFIFGNHDKVAKQMIEQHPDCFVWAEWMHLLELHKSYGVPDITLCHFAMRTFFGSHKGNWQLYGHSHNQLPEEDRWLGFDVGVDCWDYRPLSIEEVAQKMRSKIPAWEAWHATLPEGRVE
jgi:calcineurin-like phosphoesterase family protein